MREDLIDILNSFYGVDPAYFGVEAQDLADHLIDKGMEIPVRCKDCRHYLLHIALTNPCQKHDIFVTKEDFCSYGERREING